MAGAGRETVKPPGAQPGHPGSGGGDLKTGVRPDDPLPFYPTTTWAFDSCDLLAVSRPEVLARAQQVLRMREPVLVARQFAARLVDDAPAPTAVDDLVDAIGELEAALASDNVIGVIHCFPYLLPALMSAQLVARSGVGSRPRAGTPSWSTAATAQCWVTVCWWRRRRCTGGGFRWRRGRRSPPSTTPSWRSPNGALLSATRQRSGRSRWRSGRERGRSQ